MRELEKVGKAFIFRGKCDFSKEAGKGKSI